MTAAWLLLLVMFMPDRSLATRVVGVPDEATCQAIAKAFLSGMPAGEGDAAAVIRRDPTAYYRATSCIHVDAPGTPV